jgi:hypothetical protein
MSAPPAPPPGNTPTTYDSALDRAQLRWMLEQQNKVLDQQSRQMAEHFALDERMHRESSEKLDGLLTLKTQHKVLIGVVLLMGGGLLAAGRWVVGHAVKDSLVDVGVITYKRAP